MEGSDTPGESTQPIEPPPPPPAPTVNLIDAVLSENDWRAVRFAVDLAKRQLETESLVDFLAGNLPRMLFDEFRKNPTDRVIVVPELSNNENLWFIGDIHGDLLGLECALHYIRSFAPDPPPKLVFLGDLFDDGVDSYEVVLRIAQLIRDQPDAVCLLAGNHDEGLAFDDGKFHSSVQPCEFSDWLNHQPARSIQRQIGRATIKLFANLPRAVFLPDGLFVAHGGFPLKDLWEGIQSVDHLNDPKCLQDFVWTRASETARTKIPNRCSKGCQFGYEDFEGFCAVASRVTGQEVTRFIRGHDHVEERFKLYSRYRNNPILVINNMCHRLRREMFGAYERNPAIARWVPRQLPEVHRLQIPRDIIHDHYPEPGKNQLPK